MASRYIPPHLRRQSEAASQGNSSNSSNQSSEEELARRRLADLDISKHQQSPLYTLYELNKHYGCTLTQSTLRNSSSKPDQLGFVVLFHGANPRWRSDRIIFAHTHINILPGYEEFQQAAGSTEIISKGKHTKDALEDRELAIKTDTIAGQEPGGQITNKEQSFDSQTKPSPDITQTNSETEMSDTIPVFMEVAGRRRGRGFAFQGYFYLARVDFLKPKSPELVRMLQQKWDSPQRNTNAPPSRIRNRDPEAWATSLRQSWAVLQFDTVLKEQAPNDPCIEILPDEQQHFESRSAAPTSDQVESLSQAEMRYSDDQNKKEQTLGS